MEELIARKIKIRHCRAYGAVFSNLTPGSVHDIIPPPNGEKNKGDDEWVMGVGKPVKVLKGEFYYVGDE